MFGRLYIVKKNNELGGFLELDPEDASGKATIKTFGRYAVLLMLRFCFHSDHLFQRRQLRCAHQEGVNQAICCSASD